LTALVVADSSYIIHGLLKDSSLLDNDMCSPDYGLYEVLNAVWKHQVLLGRIKDSGTIIEVLFELAAAGRIRFMAMQEGTIKKAYELAVKEKITVYDSAFIALAGELGVELRTLDKRQAQIFDGYKG
jgi:predicted nucleic acid-binding protein